MPAEITELPRDFESLRRSELDIERQLAQMPTEQLQAWLRLKLPGRMSVLVQRELEHR